MSFYNWNLAGGGTTDFLGLANYQALPHDERFMSAIRNTTLFSFATVIASVLLALPIAVVLAGKIRFTPIYQAIFFLPVITPMVPMSVAWKWIFDPTHGILNYLLSLFGFSPVGWLIYPQTALWAIIAMSIWKVVGYNMVILLVGIKNIPTSYYEAARIDGAGAFRRFRYITLPLLNRTSVFVLLISFISAFQLFDPIFVMTNGGPADATTTAVYYIYRQAFQFLQLGYASALSVALFAIILVFSLLQLRVFRDRADE